MNTRLPMHDAPANFFVIRMGSLLVGSTVTQMVIERWFAEHEEENEGEKDARMWGGEGRGTGETERMAALLNCVIVAQRDCNALCSEARVQNDKVGR